LEMFDYFPRLFYLVENFTWILMFAINNSQRLDFSLNFLKKKMITIKFI
jgi:hypothetical protein